MNAQGKASAMDACVLLDLSFSRFGVQRQVRRDSVEVKAEGDEVPPEALRLSKQLIASPLYEKIVSGDGACMRAVAGLGLPYRRGLYAMPVALVERAVGIIDGWASERAELVRQLVGDYPDAIQRDRARLGPVFRLSDYPTADEVSAAFKVRWTIVELSASSKLQEISPAMFRREQEKLAAEVQNAADTWRAALREAFVTLIESLRERLDGEREGGKAKIFRDSRVDGLKEWLGIFEARNVTADSELASLVDKAKNLLGGVAAEDLREDASLRKWAASGLAEIKSAAATLVVADAPRRRFRLGDDAD